MKKIQRARLALLTAQATRTAPEEAEFKDLQALAVLHPDASKDTDEKQPVTIEALMTGFTATFSQKQVLVRENATLTKTVGDLQAGNVGAVNLVGVLTALGYKAEDFAGKDTAALVALIKAPATTDATAKDSKISALTAERDTAQGAFLAVASALGVKPADLTAATAETLAALGIKDDDDFKKLSAAQKSERIAQAAFEAVISARTLAQVKELGFNAGALPAKKPGAGSGNAKEDLVALFNAFTDPAERSAFYAENSAAMFGKN